MLVSLGWTLLALGAAGAGAVFAAYPALLRVVDALRGGERGGAAPGATGDADVHGARSVSVVVAMRNAEDLVERKLATLRAQEGVDVPLEIVLASDGSTDATAERIRTEAADSDDVRCVVLDEHGGKHVALNAAVAAARGDVLVFSDADAELDPRAVARLVAGLGAPGLGGVCGRRVIGEPDAFDRDAQSDYVALDSGLKALESRVGSVTSNDGKLFAIRRELYEPVPEGVTDDLFTAMSVVRQGKRFVYDGGARASIRVPSRSAGHELRRRRRIVCRSLRGIWLQRAVLDPRRTGLYALGLLLNKVGRRLLPLFLAAAYVGLALLGSVHGAAALAAALLPAGAALALLRPSFGWLPLPGPLERVLSLARYFLVGNAGTLLGTLDFVRGRT
ncbi:MAG: glycosyltransferase, partial [Planctomycetota bacterium]